MGHLCQFTLKSIQNIIETHQSKNQILDVQITLIGFSRGAFTILKLLTDEKYKIALDNIKIIFSIYLNSYKIISFLGDPVPGRIQIFTNYNVSKYVEKMNIYFANYEDSKLLSPFNHDLLSFENSSTKYCIFLYNENHLGIIDKLSTNINYYFNKKDQISLSIGSKNNKKPSNKRVYTKYIEKKGVRCFLNLYDQMLFKEKCPYLYKFMGFEILYTDSSDKFIEKYILDEITELERRFKLDQRFLKFMNFLETIFRNEKKVKYELLELRNIAFNRQLNLFLVDGEHNLNNVEEFNFLVTDLEKMPSIQNQSVDNNYNKEIHIKQFLISIKEAICFYKKYRLININLSTNINKILEILNFNQENKVKVQLIYNLLERCLYGKRSFMRSDFTHNFYIYYYKYLINNMKSMR